MLYIHPFLWGERVRGQERKREERRKQLRGEEIKGEVFLDVSFKPL